MKNTALAVPSCIICGLPVSQCSKDCCGTVVGPEAEDPTVVEGEE